MDKITRKFVLYSIIAFFGFSLLIFTIDKMYHFFDLGIIILLVISILMLITGVIMLALTAYSNEKNDK